MVRDASSNMMQSREVRRGHAGSAWRNRQQQRSLQVPKYRTLCASRTLELQGLAEAETSKAETALRSAGHDPIQYAPCRNSTARSLVRKDVIGRSCASRLVEIREQLRIMVPRKMEAECSDRWSQYPYCDSTAAHRSEAFAPKRRSAQTQQKDFEESGIRTHARED